MQNHVFDPDLAERGSSSNEPYDTKYFDQSLSGCVQAGKVILRRLMKNYKPASVLDVGCGVGTWLRAASAVGIKDKMGLDGDYIDRNALLFDRDLFQAADLSKPFSLHRQFDLTVCSEVAEHLPHERAPSFVRDLTATSDVVIFSAAVPFQGGDNHFNEQWPEYWAILFRRYGFVCFDLFRDLIWDDAEVESWYAQNAFLYVKAGNDLETKLKRYRADRKTLSRVHPKIFLTNITRHRPFATAALTAEISDWEQLVEAYISGASELPPLRTVMSAQTGENYEGKFPLTRMRYTDAAQVGRQHNEEIEAIETKINRLNDHAKELKALADGQATELALAAARYGLLEQEREHLLSILADQANRSELLRQDRNNVQDRLGEQINRYALLHQECVRVQDLLAEQVARAESLQQERDRVHGLLAEQVARSQSFQQEYDRLQGVLAEQVARSELLQQEHDRVQDLLAEQVARSQSFQQEYDRLQRVLAEQVARSELLQQEHDRVQDAMANQIAWSELLQQEGQRAQEKLDDQLARSQLEHDRLQSALAQSELLVQERDRLQNMLAEQTAQFELVQQQLNTIIYSSSWQATRPIRGVLRRYPRLARVSRRALKLAWWTLSLQLVARLRDRRSSRLATPAPEQGSESPAPSVEPESGRPEQPSQAAAQVPRELNPYIEREIDKLEPLGVFNVGWYGANPLSLSNRFTQIQVPSESHVESARQRYNDQTQRIVDSYYGGVVPGGDAPEFVRFGPVEMIRTAVASRLPPSNLTRSSDHPTYSIVTSYYRHLNFFRRCAISVAALLENDLQTTGERRIEWVIVNDDPALNEAELLQLVPEAISGSVRIMSVVEDGKNKGVVVPLNEGIRAAKNQWILFLDCDDRIAANATAVLDHYIRNFRHCRYISSAMADIDENDQIIRYRRHDHSPATIFETGMIAGHLKAVRRDLFDEIGLFNTEYPGCQDFDFAFRTSLREPILLIPEYLYHYRWHQDSQSVDKIGRLFRVFANIRRSFLRNLIEQEWPRAVSAHRNQSSEVLRRGICLIRTQGRRPEFLAETLHSIVAQGTPITPCLIVHAERSVFEALIGWTQNLGLATPPVVLHAGEVGRNRGYPINVGLDYITAHADNFDFFCMLDDDDIQYPLFAERMIEALRLTNADVVTALTNHRRPWDPPAAAYPPLPVSCLVAGNFIPNNAYVVRVDALLASGARVPEDMDYVEDWYFLLNLLAAGAHFELLWETVAEFRMTGDGNTVAKVDPIHYEECERRVMVQGEAAAKSIGLGAFYRDLVEFDFERRSPLRPYEIERLGNSHRIFQAQSAQPAAIDYSAAVPFGYRVPAPTPKPNLAVLCHLFYENQASHFGRYLRNISFPCDLYISTDSTAKRSVIESAFRDWNHGAVNIRVMKNQGRDIAPKLIGFPEVYKRYDYVLHLHSKTSPHAPVLAPWRDFLLDNLLGSSDIVNSVFDAFKRRPDLGIIASRHFEPLRDFINWGGCFEIAEPIARRMGIVLSREDVFDFPSGSMFWARTAALKPLLDLDLKVEDFDVERGQTDATLAHAIERLYFIVCEHAGFSWIKISQPELFKKIPAIIDLDSPHAIDRFMSEYGRVRHCYSDSTTFGADRMTPAPVG